MLLLTHTLILAGAREVRAVINLQVKALQGSVTCSRSLGKPQAPNVRLKSADHRLRKNSWLKLGGLRKSPELYFSGSRGQGGWRVYGEVVWVRRVRGCASPRLASPPWVPGTRGPAISSPATGLKTGEQGSLSAVHGKLRF